MSWEDVLSGKALWALVRGDSLEFLRQLPDNSVDSICCDPPAGIGFMQGRIAWDVPGVCNYGMYGGDAFSVPTPRIGAHKGNVKEHRKARDLFVRFITDIFTEAIRVVKPGGYGLVWNLPKTSHWTTWGIEDAGWEIRDQLFHIFGSGFNKTRKVGEQIDKLKGAERQVVGVRRDAAKLNKSVQTAPGGWETARRRPELTAPATPEAEQYEDWSTGLRPAVECWALARKPFRGTVASNVLKWGTGALNIGACRGETDYDPEKGDREGEASADRRYTEEGGTNFSMKPGPRGGDPDGRWPTHLLLSHDEECDEDTCVPWCPTVLIDRMSGYSKSKGFRPNSKGVLNTGSTYGSGVRKKDWHGPSDSGGASRYFPTFRYVKKAACSEKNFGCEDLYWRLDKKSPSGLVQVTKEEWEQLKKNERAFANAHSTVKSIELMSWLARLITPPGGLCLDLFAGSATTGLGCLKEGFRFLGVEREAEYVTIAEARMKAWAAEKPAEEPKQLTLLD